MIFNTFTVDGVTKLSAHFTMVGFESECYVETPVDHDTSNDELNEQILRGILNRLRPEGATEEQILSITFVDKTGEE